MNVLAHLALAGADAGLVVGGFLGDFIKGPVPGGLPKDVAAGVRLHRHIDAWSGRHPPLLATLEGFPSPARRMAPVALDLVADHALALHFEQLHGEALARFEARALATLDAADALLPGPARRFRERIRAVNLLQGYRQPATIRRALQWLGNRSAQPRVAAGLAACSAHFDSQRDRLVAQVLDWYPDARALADAWVSAARRSW